MTTTCKCTITRPNLDSLFVFEFAYELPGRDIVMIDRNPKGRSVEYLHADTIALHADTFILESKLSPGSPKIILNRYEEFISWNEVVERKNELRPDIRYRLDQLEILDRSTDLSIYGEGPNFNPFSLTHTRNATYETFEDWKLNYDWCISVANDLLAANNKKEDRLNRLKIVSNTLEEKLYIDGVLIEYKNFEQLY